MKNVSLNWMVVTLFALALAVTSCGKKSDVDTPTAAKSNVETANLEKSFAGSEPELQTELNSAVQAIKSEDYAGASATLQKLAANAKLTDAQKQAIQDVMTQIQKAMAEGMKEATEEADKAVEGLKDALPGK